MAMHNLRAGIQGSCLPHSSRRPVVPRLPTAANVALHTRSRSHRRVEAAAVAKGLAQQFSFPPFMPPVVRDIADPDALRMASEMRRVPVFLPSLGSMPLYTAVVGPTGQELDDMGASRNDPVLVLIHSFDSSSLEWRRTWPLLRDNLAGMPVVAIDLVGWGFTDHAAWRRDHSLPVNPALKREHLESFRQQYLGGRPLILAGTSLGGTICADYALAYPEVVQKLVLMNAQGFTEGVAPLPRPLAVLGVWVLKQIWLRDRANQMAYYDKPRFATTDAWKVGRLTTFLPGWLEANVAFINSGGFNMGEARIKQIKQQVLLIWGRHDEILSPSLADKWQAALGPSRCKLVWIEKAGHSPQLECPDLVAHHVSSFLGIDKPRASQQQEQQQQQQQQSPAAAMAVPQVPAAVEQPVAPRETAVVEEPSTPKETTPAAAAAAPPPQVQAAVEEPAATPKEAAVAVQEPTSIEAEQVEAGAGATPQPELVGAAVA